MSKTRGVKGRLEFLKTFINFGETRGLLQELDAPRDKQPARKLWLLEESCKGKSQTGPKLIPRGLFRLRLPFWGPQEWDAQVCSIEFGGVFHYITAAIPE